VFTGYRLLWCQELLWLAQLWSPCRAHRVLTQPFRLMQSCGLHQTQHESWWALIWNCYCIVLLYRLPIQVRTGHAFLSIFQHASLIVQSIASSLQLCCRLWFIVRTSLRFALITHMFMSWAGLHHMAFALVYRSMIIQRCGSCVTRIIICATPFKKWRPCRQPTQNGRARVEFAGSNNSVFTQNTVHHNERKATRLPLTC